MNTDTPARDEALLCRGEVQLMRALDVRARCGVRVARVQVVEAARELEVHRAPYVP